jgi:hypothetical protein
MGYLAPATAGLPATTRPSGSTSGVGAKSFIQPSRPRDSILVSVTPGRPLATFRPFEALGAAVDGQEAGAIDRIYTPSNLAAMQSAGLRSLTYRLRTELGDEAWHWNPQGSWSDPVHRQGYWTSSASSSVPIEVSYGYRLPRRGDTNDQANDDGYSRVDDGDPSTFWKSDPYLDQRFTGEPNDRHPQWVVVDLGQRLGVDAIRLSWGLPYAVRFTVEYWDGADHPFCPWQSGVEPCPSTGSAGVGSAGRWRPFPRGAVSHAGGGDATLRLAPAPLAVRFVRLVMTDSSGVGPPGSTDIRDSLGFALREVSVGTDDAGGFHDWVRHGPSNRGQSLVYVSSTDPWHRASDIDWNTEEPGFDRVLRSGLTNGLPTVVPVPVLFGIPEDAQAELSFLARRGFPVGRVEVGEEPDGQNVLPEDYGALFVQWARALHAVNAPGREPELDQGWTVGRGQRLPRREQVGDDVEAHSPTAVGLLHVRRLSHHVGPRRPLRRLATLPLAGGFTAISNPRVAASRPSVRAGALSRSGPASPRRWPSRHGAIALLFGPLATGTAGSRPAGPNHEKRSGDTRCETRHGSPR